MTSLERRKEARYQRRKAAREQKKQVRYGECDRLENIASYKSLYRANRKSMRNVSWKASVQRYQMNLLRNLEETRKKLLAGEEVTRGFVEFDTMERGKVRHIRSVHYSERVAQRSTCDNALVPMLSRSLIYDNGACLEGRGVDWAMDRLEAHLQQFYRANGFSNEGCGVLFDFSGYFDGILHQECFNVYDRAFLDRQIKDLLKSFVVPFGYEKFNSNWKRVDPRERGEYSGKSLGLGSQVSQITAVSYPNSLDHYIKQVLRVRWYARYMDDGYMLFKTKEEAKEALERVVEFCAKLGITVNQKKTKIVPIRQGIKFLKARHTLTDTGKVERRMCRESITRQRRRLKKFAAKRAAGEMTTADVSTAYGSWKGYALHRGGGKVIRRMDKLYRELMGSDPPICKLKKKKRKRKAGKNNGNQ